MDYVVGQLVVVGGGSGGDFVCEAAHPLGVLRMTDFVAEDKYLRRYCREYDVITSSCDKRSGTSAKVTESTTKYHNNTGNRTAPVYRATIEYALWRSITVVCRLPTKLPTYGK